MLEITHDNFRYIENCLICFGRSAGRTNVFCVHLLFIRSLRSLGAPLIANTLNNAIDSFIHLQPDLIANKQSKQEQSDISSSEQQE